MPAQKEAKLEWLKAEIAPQYLPHLSNVRCLSEGVDVPALDAVLFLTPRNSQVDVVQSVGRVMRKPRNRQKARLCHSAGGDSGRRGARTKR
jgi:predicted helicase